MFALIAVICFVLALFHVSIGAIDLVILGLLFVALHLLFAWTPWAGRLGIKRE